MPHTTLAITQGIARFMVVAVVVKRLATVGELMTAIGALQADEFLAAGRTQWNGRSTLVTLFIVDTIATAGSTVSSVSFRA
jgi:hypothetical protein